jgi:hypothetical protein
VPRIGWGILAAVAASIPLFPGLSTTEVYHVRDLGMYFWPRHIWLREMWWHGDWPLWDPHVGGGQSTVPEAINQVYMLPVALVRLVAPAVIGFNWWVAAPFPFVGLGTWLWLRRRGASPAGAFVGSAVASLSGPVLSTGNFPNLSWTAVFIPWILWGADRLGDRPTYGRFATLATLVGLQALSGEPVTFTASCVLLAAYAAVAMPFTDWPAWRLRMLRMAGAGVVGVLISAVQIVPLLVAVSGSQRAADIDTAYWSLHPLTLLETVIPHLFGHVYHDYVHAFPWVAALNSNREPLYYSVYVGTGGCALAMLGSSELGERRWRLFWWIVFLVGVLCALGDHTPFYPLLQSVVPLLKTFRFPVKYLSVSMFAVAALAASGADALLAHARGSGALRRPVAVWILLGAGGALAGTAGLAGVWRAGWLESLWIALGRGAGLADPAAGADWLMQAAAPLWIRLAVLTILMAFLVALVWTRHRFAPIAALTLCVVAVIDPVSVNYDLHPTMPAALLGPPEWLAATRAHPTDRVYIAGRLRKGTSESVRLDAPSKFPIPFEWDVQESITLVTTQFAHTPAAWGVRELISYDLLQLWPREYTMVIRAFRDASPAARLRFLRRAGTRYCLLQEPPFAGAQALAAPPFADPMVLYECYDDPRRVYLTDTAVVNPDLQHQLALMFDERHDPSAVVLLERKAGAPAGRPGEAASAPAAQVVRERNTELVVRAAVGPAGSYLNVLDSYDRFWAVEVDGEPATLLRANGVFRAVRLPPGLHDVRFFYRPTHLYVGLGLSGFSVALLFAGYWAGPAWRRSPRERRQPRLDSATCTRTP